MTCWLRTAGALLLAAASAGAIDMVSPALLEAGQPLVLRWQGQDLSLLVQLRDPDGVLGPEERYDTRAETWSTNRLRPGVSRLSARLIEPDGTIVEAGHWDVLVLPAVTTSRLQLKRLLPNLGRQAEQEKRARILAIGPAGCWDRGPTCADILATVAGRAFAAPVEVTVVPTGDLTAAGLAPLVPDWLAEHQPGAVILAAGGPELAAGVPPLVAAAVTRLLVERLIAGGVDVICLSPAPRPVGGEAGLVRALRYLMALRERLPRERLLVDSPAALWPPAATFAELEAGLLERVQPDGRILPRGHFALANAVLARLRPGQAAPPPVSVTAAGELRASGSSTLIFELRNRTDSELWANLLIFRPAGLTGLDGLTVTLPAGGTSRATRAVAMPVPGGLLASADLPLLPDLGEPILGALLCQNRYSAPLALDLGASGLGAAFLSERRIDRAEGTARLLIANGLERSLRGVVVGPPGSWQPVFEAPAGVTSAVVVPLPLTDRRRGAVQLSVEAVAGDARAPATTIARYVGAVAARSGPSTIDGDLGEWEQATWYAIDERSQVIDAPDGWEGPADGTLRFAVRSGPHGLAMAVLWSDESALPEDTLELCWDPRDPEADVEPGLVSRLRIPLLAGEPTGLGADSLELARVPEAGVLELALPWAALGLDPPPPNRLMGFDLLRVDEDADQAPVRASFTGERWAVLDTARLGLLVLDDLRELAPLRVLVHPDDGELPLP